MPPPADASINYVFGGLICILVAFILHKIMKRSSYMDEESEFDDEESEECKYQLMENENVVVV